MVLEISDDTKAPAPERSEWGGPVEDAYEALAAGPVAKTSTDLPPAMATGLELTDGDQVLASCSGGRCTPGRRGDSTTPTPDSGDRTARPGSFAEKVQGFIRKLGEFLTSVLPREFAEPAKQFLGQIGRFLTENLRGVDLGDRKPDGSRPIEVNFDKPVTIPKAVGGQDLEVGPKLSFDMKVGPRGPELNNIKGLKVKVAGGLVDADVSSARLVRDENGKLSLEARVKAGVLPESTVKIPLNRTSLLPGRRK